MCLKNIENNLFICFLLLLMFFIGEIKCRWEQFKFDYEDPVLSLERIIYIYIYIYRTQTSTVSTRTKCAIGYQIFPFPDSHIQGSNIAHGQWRMCITYVLVLNVALIAILLVLSAS